jgi:hypothetical protein
MAQPWLNSRLTQDQFGYSTSVSNNKIVVGAPSHDYDNDGLNLIINAGAAFVFERPTSTWTFVKKLTASLTNGTSNRIASDLFGFSTSIDGDTIVIGAPYQDTDADGSNNLNNAGAAFVYFWSGISWTVQAKLVGSGTNGRASNDSFGFDVSISTNSIVVGAIAQDTDNMGSDSRIDAGAAYLFKWDGISQWLVDTKISAPGTNGRNTLDNFGRSVSIKGDALAIGAPNQNYDASGGSPIKHTGAVFAYKRNISIWNVEGKLVDSTNPGSRTDLANSALGSSMAISKDGLTLVVGAPGDSTDADGTNYVSKAGAVFVYAKISGGWVLKQKLVGPGTYGRLTADNFGYSVAIDGDTMVVGAPNQSYDAIGIDFKTNAGAAFVFVKAGDTWTHQQKLVGFGLNGRMASDRFGLSVAISGDTAVIGADSQDYDAVGSPETPRPSAGAAYVYTRIAGIWSTQLKLTAVDSDRQANDNFGRSVAIDGDTIAIGASSHGFDALGSNLATSAGAVFVFTRAGVSWNAPTKLVPTISGDRTAYDHFGCSIALNGNTLVSGAFGQTKDENGGGTLISGAGAAYVFSFSEGIWSQLQKLVAQGTNARMPTDAFGSSVALSGDTIVIGAPKHSYDITGDNLQTGAGAAFVFSKTGPVWAQQLKLIGQGVNGRNPDDNFGQSVSASENGASDGFSLGVGAAQQPYSSQGHTPVPGAGAFFMFY